KSLNLPFTIDNEKITVNASIGIATRLVKDTVDLEKLIRDADNAMYVAKNNFNDKGNSVYLLNDQYNNELMRAHTIGYHLLTVIDNNEFYLGYEPIFHLKENRLVGGEVVLRGRSEKLGDVSPSEFIPFLENN